MPFAHWRRGKIKTHTCCVCFPLDQELCINWDWTSDSFQSPFDDLTMDLVKCHYVFSQKLCHGVPGRCYIPASCSSWRKPQSWTTQVPQPVVSNIISMDLTLLLFLFFFVTQFIKPCRNCVVLIITFISSMYRGEQ